MNLEDVTQSFQDAPRIEKGEYTYLVHPLLDGVPRVAPELIHAFAAWASTLPCVREATVLLAPEAMAIPLATALGQATGLPFLVARKRAYTLDGEFQVRCRTGYNESTYFVNDLRPQDRIVLVDDVVSTGGTLEQFLKVLLSRGLHVTGTVVALDKWPNATPPTRLLGTYHALCTGYMEAKRFVSVTPN